MTEFWDSRSPREKLLIRIAAVLAAVFLVLQGVLAPIGGWRQAKEAELVRAEGLYEIVAEATAFATTGSSGGAGSSTPVRNAVTTTAAQLGVELVFVNARPDGAVEANAAPSDPQALFDWIGALSREHGVQIIYADLARDPADRRKVRGRLILSRGGAGS